MSSPNAHPPSSPDWHKLPALIKEWKEVLVIAAGALAAALTTIGVKAQGKALIIGYALVLLLLGVGVYVAYRVKRRRELARQRAQLRETFESRRQHRTAFRGLYPYQEGETLPGYHRKREAQTIFTQITDAGFSFGVVCGDSGCGKTSLLRCALQARLKEAEAQTGLRVLYVRSPRELIKEPGWADGLTEEARLRRQMTALRQSAARAGAGAPLVIILDQFEEFFIGYKSGLRGQLGSYLNEMIRATPQARILCAVRRDYLMDMHDLAPQLPEPISVTTLFTIKNFTSEQAADVIQECAALDGLELDPSLPAPLAKDLAEGEFIRPPELQIVCTALVSNPTLSAYRLRGGAQGILSYHIQSAIMICGDPKLGSQILQALCDFPAHAKRNPQTVDELLPALELPAGLGREQADRAVADILARFEAARLVLVDTRGAEATYALVHDYLVDAVSAATSSDAKNRREKANQLLQYYIAEHSADPQVKMPLRRRRFISRYADKSFLAEPRARQLFRVSRNAFIRNVVALLVLIVISTATLLTALNTHRAWEPTEVNRTLPEAKKNQLVAGYIYDLPDQERLLTIADTPEAGYARLWDSKTAALLSEIKADDFLIDDDKQFLLVHDKGAHSVYAVHLATGEKHPLPVSAAAVDRVDIRDSVVFGAAAGVVMISQFVDGAEGAMQDGGVQIWSILQQRELGRVKPVAWWRPLHLDKSSSRLVGLHWVQEGKDHFRWSWSLWNARTGERIAELTKDEYLRLASDEGGTKLVLVTRSDNQPLTVHLYDLRTGHLLRKESVPDKEPREDIAVTITGQGDFVALTSIPESGPGKLLAILNASDLLPAPLYARNDLRWAYRAYSGGSPPKVSWSADGATYVSDVTGQPPKLLQGLTLQPPEKEDGIWREKIFIDKRGARAVVPRHDERLELYDLSDGRKISELSLAGLKEGFYFTYEGRALELVSADGRGLLYDLENGRKMLELPNVGAGSRHFMVYNAECHQVNVWFEDGPVQRYAEGVKILGRWFWPTTMCRN